MTTTVAPWEIQAGEPFDKVVRLVEGKTIWATVGAFEVRMQIREENTMPSKLLFDCSPFFEKAIDGNDLIATLHLSGNQTRQMKGNGFFDVFFSDAGPTDEHAIRLFKGTIVWTPAFTSGA